MASTIKSIIRFLNVIGNVSSSLIHQTNYLNWLRNQNLVVVLSQNCCFFFWGGGVVWIFHACTRSQKESLSQIVLLLMWTEKVYRHFSELITSCLRNVILTCSCSSSRFPLVPGCAPLESAANPHFFQQPLLADLLLFFIPSHFPLVTNKNQAFTGLGEKRCWNWSWSQTPYQTLNWRIHVFGIFCCGMESLCGRHESGTRAASQRGVLQQGCSSADPQSWSVIPRRACLHSQLHHLGCSWQRPRLSSLPSGCVRDPAAAAEEEDYCTNTVRCLCHHMQTPTANLDWNRRCVNKAECNLAEPDEIFPP